MAKPTAEEIAKLKERIAALSPDEREAVVEALEPDILKKVMALLKGAPPEPVLPEPPKKKAWYEALLP